MLFFFSSKSHLSRLYREQDGSSEPQCPANVPSQLGFILWAGFYISPSFPILSSPLLSQTCVSRITQKGFLTNSTLIRWNRSIVQIFHFLRLKSRMLTSPSLTLISIWTLRSRMFWLVWTVHMISLFIVLQMPEFVKIFPNYSTAKTAPAGEWMKWTVHCQHFSTLKTDKQLQESLLIANHLNFSRQKDSGIAIQIYKELLFRFLQYSCHKD